MWDERRPWLQPWPVTQMTMENHLALATSWVSRLQVVLGDLGVHRTPCCRSPRQRHAVAPHSPQIYLGDRAHALCIPWGADRPPKVAWHGTRCVRLLAARPPGPGPPSSASMNGQ